MSEPLGSATAELAIDLAIERQRHQIERDLARIHSQLAGSVPLDEEPRPAASVVAAGRPTCHVYPKGRWS